MDFAEDTEPFSFDCETDLSDSDSATSAGQPNLEDDQEAGSEKRPTSDVEMEDDPSLRGLDTADEDQHETVGNADIQVESPTALQDGNQSFYIELPSDSDSDVPAGESVPNIEVDGSFHIDLPSASDDDESVDSPGTGPSFQINQTLISNRYLHEHVESLRWMYSQLRSRNNLMVRLRELMRRDLEAIERAIRLREEEEKLEE